MTLHPYNKDLLEFMYSLTTVDEFMNIDQATQHFNSSRENGTSSRTIRRWLDFLNFGYYPEINYEEFGLVAVTVCLSTRKELPEELLPHSFHVSVCSDITDLGEVFCISYLIPYDKINDFKKSLEALKEKEIIKTYNYFIWRSSVSFYLPFHKNVDENGIIHIKDNTLSKDVLSSLKQRLSEPINVKINELVKKNPFILPVLFEYARECWSSTKVWFTIKEKLRDNTWNYIKDIKKRIKRRDGVGIKFVQETMTNISKNKTIFYKDIAIAYVPFFNKDNISFYLHLELKDRHSILPLSKVIASSSLMSILYLPVEDPRNFMFFILTSNENLIRIVKKVKEYTNSAGNHKILILDRKGTDRYWKNYQKYLKFDYAKYFDPKKVKWKYLFEEKRV